MNNLLKTYIKNKKRNTVKRNIYVVTVNYMVVAVATSEKRAHQIIETIYDKHKYKDALKNFSITKFSNDELN